MDILNWLYLRKQQLIKTEANNAATDIVILGAEVPFTQRGDGYQSYAMSLANAVEAGCIENNTYRTGVYNEYPYIVTPSLIKTCTRIQSTGGMVPENTIIEGFKIAGVIDISSGPVDAIYLGTVQYTPDSGFSGWKVTGQVSAYDGDTDTQAYSTFSNKVFLNDDTTGSLVETFEMRFVIDTFAPGMADVYLIYAANTANNVNGTISFEFESLGFEGVTPTLVIY